MSMLKKLCQPLEILSECRKIYCELNFIRIRDKFSELSKLAFYTIISLLSLNTWLSLTDISD